MSEGSNRYSGFTHFGQFVIFFAWKAFGCFLSKVLRTEMILNAIKLHVSLHDNGVFELFCTHFYGTKKASN